ncbi:class I SAM-dependent methyltransferase [Kribbella deserti]|uniref:Class I SAM-dependent methyltransferase n=1 Tax=Kribbella deserti TaxID=1926257 RepID=A0ABV6QSK0_9ACTN
MTTTRAIRDNYSRVATAYDGVWADTLALHAKAVADRLPLTDARRVAELGCGPGRLLPHLADRAPQATVIGADLTEAMLQRAPAAYGRVVADVQALPFADGVLDAVVMPFVLFHLPDLPLGLSEVRRVLRTGGSFAAVTWSTHDPHPAYDVWVRVIEDFGAPPDPSPQMPSGAVTADPEALGQAVRTAGFGEVRITPEPFRHQSGWQQFIEHSKVVGSMARRLELLAPERRTACLTVAARELSQLDAEDFVESGNILYTTAVAGSNE